MSNKKSLAESVTELMSKLDEPVSGAQLITNDLTEPYSHLLNEKVKVKLSIRHKTLTPSNQDDPKKFDTIAYLSVTARGSDNIYEAAKMIAAEVNQLADKGYLTGFLAPLGYMSLRIDGLSEFPYVVFCFPSVTQEGSDWIDAHGSLVYTKEGGIGPLSVPPNGNTP